MKQKSARDDHDDDADSLAPTPPRSLAHTSTKTVKVDEDGTTKMLPPRHHTYEVGLVDKPQLCDRVRSQSLLLTDIPAPDPLEVDDRPEWDGKDLHIKEEPTPSHEVSELRQGPPPKRQKRRLIDKDGTTCHQCRRKTSELKMRCCNRDGDKECRLYFCPRCLDIRYGIETDLSCQDFHCPRCIGYCNCS